MNKKRLLVFMLIVLALTMFVACDDSPTSGTGGTMNSSLVGTWEESDTFPSGESKVTITTRIILSSDSTFSQTYTVKTDESVPETETINGTYVFDDSTLTMTVTSITPPNGGDPITGTDNLVNYINNGIEDDENKITEKDLILTESYSIIASGSTVTLTLGEEEGQMILTKTNN